MSLAWPAGRCTKSVNSTLRTLRRAVSLEVAMPLFKRAEQSGGALIAGTVPYHNAQLFLCSDAPPSEWGSATEELSALGTLREAVASRATANAGSGGGGVPWDMKITLCETPLNALAGDLLSFPLYRHLRPDIAPAAQALSCAQAAELSAVDRATVERAAAAVAQCSKVCSSRCACLCDSKLDSAGGL
eukprot:SAG11_NODE_175_length_13457_cov_42.095673_10_plen_188_part_00